MSDFNDCCTKEINIEKYYLPTFDYYENKYLGQWIEYRCKICNTILKRKFTEQKFYERN